MKCKDGDVKRVNPEMGESLIRDFPRNFFLSDEAHYTAFLGSNPKRAQASEKADKALAKTLRRNLRREATKRKEEVDPPEGFSLSDEVENDPGTPDKEDDKDGGSSTPKEKEEDPDEVSTEDSEDDPDGDPEEDIPATDKADEDAA